MLGSTNSYGGWAKKSQVNAEEYFACCERFLPVVSLSLPYLRVALASPSLHGWQSPLSLQLRLPWQGHSANRKRVEQLTDCLVLVEQLTDCLVLAQGLVLREVDRKRGQRLPHG